MPGRRRAALCLLLVLALGPAMAPAAWADFAAGFAAFQKGRYAVALKELRPLAKAGDKRAQFLLGRMYRDGLGVKKSAGTAFDWLSKAAEGADGDRYALHDLAVLYERGTGTKKNLDKAVALYRRAVARGVPSSMLNLGVLMSRGEGLKRDLAGGLLLIWRAYEAGHAEAGATFDKLAKAVGGDPPAAGRWRSVAYAGPGDDPNMHNLPSVAKLALGIELRLGRAAFELGRLRCKKPVFLTSSIELGALVDHDVGLTRVFRPESLGPAQEPVRTLEVVCDRTVRASIGLLDDGRLLLAALGGYLIMEPAPSARVEEAQRRLAALGYDAGSADGVFGDKTAAAISAFQAAAGIPVSGGLDEPLLERLRVQAPQ
jgi:TPR repeat protein